jgi:hypothetical protein
MPDSSIRESAISIHSTTSFELHLEKSSVDKKNVPCSKKKRNLEIANSNDFRNQTDKNEWNKAGDRK